MSDNQIKCTHLIHIYNYQYNLTTPIFGRLWEQFDEWDHNIDQSYLYKIDMAAKIKRRGTV